MTDTYNKVTIFRVCEISHFGNDLAFFTVTFPHLHQNKILACITVRQF